MLYDKYKRAILKIANVFAFVKKHKIKFLALSVLLVAMAVTLMGVKGTITDAPCPAEFTYGDQFSYSASAVMGEITYQFQTPDSNEWTNVYPRRAGVYNVRATSTGTFGDVRYGDVQRFSILPKKITIVLEDSPTQYGDLPTLTSPGLEYGDYVTCDEFEYQNLSSSNATAIPNAEKIRIFDNDGVDVTSSYDFDVQEGIVNFVKRSLSLSFDAMTKVYDGERINPPSAQITDGSLAFGDELKVTFSKDLIDVGVMSNKEPSVKIVNLDGDDVTDKYAISVEKGKIEVQVRHIEVTSSSREWVYDGSDKFLTEFVVSADTPIVNGHRLVVVENATIKTVGETDNLLEFAVYNQDDEDVTDNYDISLTAGTLSVVKREITFATADAERVYDATALFNVGDYSVVSGILPDGFGTRVTRYATQNEVGATENALQIAILDNQGNDVSFNFEIAYVNGTLTVTPYVIEVQVGSQEWVYDGNTHTYDGFTIVSVNQLLNGHNAKASNLKAEIIDVGGTDNDLEIEIFEIASGLDVTKNYSITYQKGGLTVTKRPITIAPKDHSWVYDDTTHCEVGFDVPSSLKIVEGHRVEVLSNTQITYVGSVANQLTVDVFDGDVRVTDNYDISYTEGTLTVTPRPIIVTANSASKVYDDTPLADDGYFWTRRSTESNDTGLIENHTLSASVDADCRITDVGERENLIVEGSVFVQDADGNDVTANYTVTIEKGTLKVEKRKISVVSNANTWQYDNAQHVEEGYEITSALQPVDGHTVIVDYRTAILDAGAVDNVLSVSIYRHYGDVDEANVTANYEISYPTYGILTVTPRPIAVQTRTASWVYDGEEHSSPYVDVVESSMLTGHQIGEIIACAKIVNVGSVDNTIAFTIVENFGETNERDVSDNYLITYHNGVLTVTQRPITVTASSDEKIYDDTPLTSDGYVWTAFSTDPQEGLVTGHTVNASMTADSTITDVGTTANVIADGIKIMKGAVDVTANYAITTADGVLTITARPIRVLTPTNSWVYDDTPRFDLNVVDVDGQLVSGHTFKPENKPSITYVAESGLQNDVLVTIRRGNDDKSANYDVSYVYGTLSITKRPITITAGNAEKIYDGTPLTVGTVSATPYSVAPSVGLLTNRNHTIVANMTAESVITNAGSAFNVIADGLSILDGNGVDVTVNYEISTEKGTLTVVPRKIKVTSATAEKVYDGTPLTCNVLTTDAKENDGIALIAGQELYVPYGVTFASITDVGEVDNEFDGVGVWQTSDHTITTDNYDIEYAFGTLKITPIVLTYSTSDAEKVYDDTALSAPMVTYEYTEGTEVAGEEITIYSTTSITNVGTVINGRTTGEDDVFFAVSDGVNDKTDNYVIVEGDLGTLTVSKRAIKLLTATNAWLYDDQIHFDEGVILHPSSAYGLCADHQFVVTTHTEVEDYTPSAIVNALSVEIRKAEHALAVGELADKSDNYDITYQYGTLSVDKRTVKVQSPTREWVYDGAEHCDVAVFTAEDSSYQLVEGHVYAVLDGYATITNYVEGGVQNTVKVKISGTDGDKSANYDVSYVYGSLSLTKRPITVSADNAEKIYDGTPLTADYSWTLFAVDPYEVGLVDGHSVFATMTAESVIINAGSVFNVIADGSVIITDADDNDVTFNYDISTEKGVLTVFQRRIGVWSSGAEKVYDATPLECKTYVAIPIESDGISLVEGQEFYIPYGTTFASITDVGEVDNVFSDVGIRMADDSAVITTENYIIEKYYGILKVTPIVLTYSTSDAEKVYDDTALSAPTVNYVYTEGSAVAGHTINIYAITTITNVGEVVNGKIDESAEINDIVFGVSDGAEDKTSNYVIEAGTLGILTVTARPITITTASDQKEYDGSPLFNAGYTYTRASETEDDTGLLDGVGHSISVSVVGSITDYGEVENSVGVVVIVRGADIVTTNYDIITELGALSITKRQIKVQTPSATWVYDGNSHYATDMLTTDDSPNGLVYGDLLYAKEYTAVTEVRQDVENVITAGVKRGGSDISANYEIVGYVNGALTVTKRSVTLIAMDGARAYDGTPFVYHEFLVFDDPLNPNDGIINGMPVAVFAEESTLTYVGTASNVITNVKIYQNYGRSDESDATANYDITTIDGTIEVLKRNLIVTCQPLVKGYDGTPLIYAEDLPVEFSSTDGAIALGVGDVARFTRNSITDVGSAPCITDLRIENADSDDVTANYEVEVHGTISIGVIKLVVKVEDAEKVYDGTPLTSNAVSYKLYLNDDEIELPSGYTVTAFATGSQLAVGSSAKQLIYDSWIVKNADGDDVTSNYLVEGDPYVATLTVYPREITVSTADVVCTYDDQPHRLAEDAEITVVSTNSLDGAGIPDLHYYTVTYNSATDVAESGVDTVSILIKTINGDDVTENYLITYEGEIKIAKRRIVLSTGDYTGVYDGQPHYNTDVTIEDGELCEGHTVEGYNFRSITDYVEGGVENVMSFRVLKDEIALAEGEQNDKTSNYNIIESFGKLTVEKRIISVVSADGEWVYDGQLHFNPTVDYADDTEYYLLDGHYFAAINYTKVRSVTDGTPNEVTVYVTSPTDVNAQYNYDILVQTGVLVVTPRPITITAGSATKVYDGTPLTQNECEGEEFDEINNTGLVSGHTVIATATGSQTDVGSSANTIDGESIVIMSGIEDVTDNYTITVDDAFGTLTVTPRPIEIRSGSATKTYDGTPLIGDGCEYDEFDEMLGIGLVDGHTVVINPVGSQTNVGTSDNIFDADDVTIYEKYGEEDERDVTANYNISTQYGTLTVTKRQITVVTDDVTRVYDGTEFCVFEDVAVEIVLSQGTDAIGDALVAGHTYSVTRNSITNVGSVYCVEIDVLDGDVSVLDNYDVTYVGELTVTPRPITVTANSASKLYDDTPLVCDGYVWTAFSTEPQEGLIVGHTIEAQIVGEITKAGSTVNRLTSVVIMDDETDVSNNYEITKVDGVLTVDKRNITVQTASRSFVYDGTAQSALELVVVDGDGLVTGHFLSASEVFATVTDVNEGEVENVIEAKISDVNDYNKSENYIVTYVNGVISVTPRPITITAGSATKVYDGTPLTQNECEGEEFDEINNTGLVSGHTVIATATGSQTNVGSSANTIDGNVIIYANYGEETEIEVTENYNISIDGTSGTLTVVVRNIVVQANDYVKLYDGTPLEYPADDDVWCSFNGREGLVNGHTAVYTRNAITEVGEVYSVTVTAIMDGDDDVTSNYGLIYQGKLTVVSNDVIVKVVDAERTYDGTPFTSDAVICLSANDDVANEAFAEFTATAQTLGTITDAGTTDNYILDGSVRIFDKNGTDVTAYFNVTTQSGELSVTPRAITVTTDNVSVEYDDTPHSYVGADPVITLSYGDGDGIVSLHKYEVLVNQIVDAGYVDNISIIITTLDGLVDVTDNYVITYYGKLTVEKRNIVVATGDYDGVYDGEEHFNTTLDYDANGLCADHSFVVIAYPSVLNVSDCPIDNELSVKIVKAENALQEGEDADKSANYVISWTCGTLNLTRREITVQTESKTLVYNGTAQSALALNLAPTSSYGLVDGHTLIADSGYATVTNVGDGDVENVVTALVFEGDEDVSDNYDITYVNGIISVTKRPITITAGSATKVYDGTPLTQNECVGDEYDELNHVGLVDGHVVTAVMTAESTITDVGVVYNVVSSVNTVVIMDGDEDVTDNYNIALAAADGVLTVTARPLKIIVTDAEKIYDGTPITSDEYTQIGLLAELGHYVANVEFVGTQTNAGNANNTVVISSVVIKNAYDTDVTANYDVSCIDGTLTVRKRPIIVTADSLEKVYDDEEMGLEYGSEVIIEYAYGGESIADLDGIIDGQTGIVTYTRLVNVGVEYSVSLQVVDVFDEYIDYTDNYDVTYRGTLVITARPITVIAGSVEDVYDGEEITCADYTLGEYSQNPPNGLLVNLNHQFSANTVGSQINVGSSANRIDVDSVLITRENGDDVTANYEIITVDGEITVTKRPITITADSASKIYDGVALVVATYESTAFDEDGKVGLVPLHIVVATPTGAQTAVGSSENVLDSADIYDQNSLSVTDNYDITYVNGVLTVEKRNIDVETESHRSGYTGNPLVFGEDEEVSITSPHGAPAIVAGQYPVIQRNSITDIGTISTVTITRVIDEYGSPIDGDGNAYIDNYSITYHGTLEVAYATVVIAADNGSKVYDGTVLVVSTFNYYLETEEGEISNLPSGYSIVAQTSGIIAEVGVIDNVIVTDSIVIRNADDEDVTHNFRIRTCVGSLEVTPRPISVTANSYSKVYDGNPLVYPDDLGLVEVNSTLDQILVTGHTYVVTANSITEIGWIYSVEVVIENVRHDDVSHNYKIEYDGTLVVKEHESDDDNQAPPDGYGGSLNSSGGFGFGDMQDGNPDTPARIAVEIASDYSGRVYLRYMSFGDYNKTKWINATSYDQLIDDYGYNYLMGLNLTDGVNEHTATIKSYSNYLLPYYTAPSGNHVRQTSDVINNKGRIDDEYTVGYYTLDGVVSALSVEGEYSAIEAEYREFVYQNYLQIPMSTKIFAQGIIEEQGFEAYDNQLQLIEAVVSYVQSSATYSLKYDRALDSADDVMVAFLSVYKEGICQHFATTATMLFRALGIPARYTIGYVGNTVAGEVVSITTQNAHAWTEIYVDGFGWVQLEVTGGGSGYGGGEIGGEGGESGEIDPQEVTEFVVRPVDVMRQYDGTPLVHSGELTGDANFVALMQNGYKYVASVDGEIYGIGTCKSSISAFRLLDGNGNDVTNNYSVDYQQGDMAVYKRDIRLITQSREWVYDGEEHYYDKVTDQYGKLLDGHRIVADNPTVVRNVVDSVQNVVDVAIFDAEDNDVTEYYNVEIEYGNLSVLSRSVTVTANTASKAYDGTPLVDADCVYDLADDTIDTGLIQGHTINVTVIGSQTEIGSSANRIIAVTIMDGDGNDVTGNYAIELVDGVLEIRRRILIVTAYSDEKVYDGTPLTCDGYSYSEYSAEEGTGLLSGHTLVATVNGSITNAGYVANVITSAVVKQGETNVNDYYEITYTSGSLNILKRPVTITTSSASKTYDGTPLTSGGYTCTKASETGDDTGLLDTLGHQLSLTVIGTRTDAGVSPNDVDGVVVTDGADNDVTANYNLNYVKGGLTVYPRKVYVTAGSAMKVYDGTPLTCADYVWDVDVEYADVKSRLSVSATTYGEIVNAGTQSNVIVEDSVVIMLDGEETVNYVATLYDGTLVITRRHITVTADSGEKPYDGRPLVVRTVTYTELEGDMGLLGGQMLTARTVGSQTVVGSSDNVVGSVTIFDDGNDVTDNYDIFRYSGTLTVTESGETPPENVYLDQTGNFGTDGDASDPTAPERIAVLVEADHNGQIYLRMMSYGDYLGSSWDQASPYDELISGRYALNYLPSLALDASGQMPFGARITSYGDYLLPYYSSVLGDYEVQTNDVINDGSVVSPYFVYYHALSISDAMLLANNLGSYQSAESEYRLFVYSNYLSIPSSTRAYFDNLINSLGYGALPIAQKIASVISYISTSAEYNLNYDQTLNTESDVVVAFLNDYKEGVCKHFASAATLMFRALGIPARYTVGYYGETEKDTEIAITTRNAHAWTEIYLDGFGWVQIDATGGSYSGGNIEDILDNDGTLPDIPDEIPEDLVIPLRPLDVEKTYDGTPLYAVDRLDTIVETVIASCGFKYVVTVEGSRTEVGSSVSTITSFVLLDGNGNDITDQFTFSYHTGLVTVLEEEMNTIQIMIYQTSKSYNGKPIYYDPDNWELLTEGFTVDFRLEYPDGTPIGITDVGEYSLELLKELPITIYDSDNNDVTSEYDVVFVGSPLTVNKAKITITSGSSTQRYNEEPLSNDTFEVSFGRLPSGHVLTVTLDTVATEIGTVDNDFCVADVLITDGNGRDVTDFFDITCVFGQLILT